ncbi:solute carrier family 22 member 7-like [Babylonia areolata]|uniref:solute carrier family 22 member 7-like n=1 Tax=Babylonia areolata TaxID=304850 RepID=UPI003FD31A69
MVSGPTEVHIPGVSPYTNHDRQHLQSGKEHCNGNNELINKESTEETKMKEKGDIDPTLRILGGRGAPYQLLQVLAISLGCLGACYQLMINVFIGRAVEGLQCAEPAMQDNHHSDTTNSTERHNESTFEWDWRNNSSNNVSLGQCEITVYKNNLSVSDDGDRYPCPYGYQYSYERELSFRTEFDLVCNRKLLGSLVQTLVIAGQGIGAVLASIVSDRYGRKPTMIGSQFALFLLGMGVGLSPSYPVLAVLKFLIGGFQQGTVTAIATLIIELYPMEHRSIQVLGVTSVWGIASSSLSLVGYLMREYSWRYMQYALSSVSLLTCILQLWCVDESLRWLVANGKTEGAVRVLRRAARVNRKDVNLVLNSLQHTEGGGRGGDGDGSGTDEVVTEMSALASPDTKDDREGGEREKVDISPDSPPHPHLPDVDGTLAQKQTQKLTVLDIFRHKRLLAFAAVNWLAWFTCSFSYFALFMMSTSLHGNRFLNFFLVCLMEFVSSLLLYYLSNRVGRKNTACVSFLLAGIGLVSSGVCMVFRDRPVVGSLSVAFSMLGVVGAAGAFGLVFLYTPELFPTNMRQQALGVSSFAGRLGGMLGPFMTDLAEVSVWAPGALVGSFCFLVAILFRFLPETRGREVPHTITDIKSWR